MDKMKINICVQNDGDSRSDIVKPTLVPPNAKESAQQILSEKKNNRILKHQIQKNLLSEEADTNSDIGNDYELGLALKDFSCQSEDNNAVDNIAGRLTKIK